MALFNFHHITFSKVDPLGDGLREEIEAERLEPEAITLDENLDAAQLEQYLHEVIEDPERLEFSDSDK